MRQEACFVSCKKYIKITVVWTVTLYSLVVSDDPAASNFRITPIVTIFSAVPKTHNV